MATLRRDLSDLDDSFVLGELLESDYREKRLELLRQLRDAGETYEHTNVKVQEITDSRNVPFCLIQPGGFYFGPEDEWRELDCQYYMSKFPITVREFKEFLADTDYDYPEEDLETLSLVSPEDDCPASHLSYNDAKEFCRWLRRETGEYYSLPHEIEWEYAARGGDARFFPWGNSKPDQETACFQGEIHYNCTVPVYTYQERNVSPFGLVDMVGNVWEWCLDTFEDERDPHILRGGSWCNDQEYANVVARTFSFPPTQRIDYGGFRVIHLPGDMLTEYRTKYAERGVSGNLKVVNIGSKQQESGKSTFSALGKALETAAAAVASGTGETGDDGNSGEINDAMAMAISGAASMFLRKSTTEDAFSAEQGTAVPTFLSARPQAEETKAKSKKEKEPEEAPPGLQRPQYKSIDELRQERASKPPEPKGPQLEFEEETKVSFVQATPLNIPPMVTLAGVVVWFILLAGIIATLAMRLTNM